MATPFSSGPRICDIRSCRSGVTSEVEFHCVEEGVGLGKGVETSCLWGEGNGEIAKSTSGMKHSKKLLTVLPERLEGSSTSVT